MTLKETFSRGMTPDPSELRGYYNVRLVTPVLPEIRFFGHRKFFPDDAADENGGPGGFNEFMGRIRIGSFKISVRDSALGDGQRVLHINYNRRGNSFILRALNDEVKRVGEGHYLGRGVFKICGLVFNSFYFSVRRA
ncbi:MAG: hypothetical protein KA369_08825 [Spirochaetes bacterium]|nr:hypothetical protein [Spirochaetota bacterium]